MSLEDAARQAGIPLEEIYEYINARLGKVDTINWQLRLIGQRGLEKSLTKLTELAAGDSRIGQFFESTDLLAARELARISMEAIKLSQKGAAPRSDSENGKPDLFDSAADPWDVNKPE